MRSLGTVVTGIEFAGHLPVFDALPNQAIVTRAQVVADQQAAFVGPTGEHPGFVVDERSELLRRLPLHKTYISGVEEDGEDAHAHSADPQENTCGKCWTGYGPY